MRGNLFVTVGKIPRAFKQHRDFEEEKWKRDAARHCSVALGKDGFIVSGCWLAESLVEMYNISNKTWTNLTCMPREAERAYHGCTMNMINRTHKIVAGRQIL